MTEIHTPPPSEVATTKPTSLEVAAPTNGTTLLGEVMLVGAAVDNSTTVEDATGTSKTSRTPRTWRGRGALSIVRSSVHRHFPKRGESDASHETLSTANISIGGDVFGTRLTVAHQEFTAATEQDERLRDASPETRFPHNKRLLDAVKTLEQEKRSARDLLRRFAEAPPSAVMKRYTNTIFGLAGTSMPEELRHAYADWRAEQQSHQKPHDVLAWAADHTTDEQLVQLATWYKGTFEAHFARPEIIAHIAEERAAWEKAVAKLHAENWYGNGFTLEEIKDREVHIVDPIGVGHIFGDAGAHEQVGGYVKTKRARRHMSLLMNGVRRTSVNYEPDTVINLPASSLTSLKENVTDALFHEGNHTLGGFGVTWLDEGTVEHEALVQKNGDKDAIHPEDRNDRGAYPGYRALTAVTAYLWGIPVEYLTRARTDHTVSGANSRKLFDHLQKQGEPEALEIITSLLDDAVDEHGLNPGEYIEDVYDDVAGLLAEQLWNQHRNLHVPIEERDQLIIKGKEDLELLKIILPENVPRIK